MSVAVVATIFPVPERRDEVLAAFEAACARVHAEDDGCELYALHQGDDRLVMIEKWASGEALGAHARSAALRELNQKLDGLLRQPTDVQVLRPHPAGTAEQGTL